MEYIQLKTKEQFKQVMKECNKTDKWGGIGCGIILKKTLVMFHQKIILLV